MQERLSKIKLLALDVDGVLTDGTINIGDNGELFKGFNAKDGLGISCALRSGLNIAIITGRKSEIIHKRAGELGITLLCEGVKDKYAELVRLTEEMNFTQEQVAYMGDDIPDYEVLQRCGLPCCPSDAAHEIKSICKYISHKEGGKGCVRDIVEQILKAQNLWMHNSAAFGW